MEDKSHHDDTSDVPVNLSYQSLKVITADFADENKLGRGAFGEVYKGVLKDGKVIAVKMLRWMPEIDDRQFKNEFKLLEKLKHQNIVQLVGFCNEIEKIPMLHEGKEIIAEDIHRAICLEFVPNGSLGNFLQEQSPLFDWDMRLKIIKGICHGLRYLHKLEIMHIDLKPDNILIDEKIQAKIADFGMSRLVGTANTIRTMTPQGTLGYIPPEFIEQQIISYKYDIFSLGVIIKKIVDSDIGDMADKEFIEHLLEKWKKRFQAIPGYAPLHVEVSSEQVRTCIEMAADCMKRDWRNRPTMDEIVYTLDELETEAARLRMMFNDDEKPPRIKGNSLSDLVRMKPVNYLKKNALLTADAVTVELELYASVSTIMREKIDLVVLLDVSGIMASETMDNMKNSIKYVIMKLTPLDRLSIVTFSDSATRQCPLRCMTQSAQNDLKAMVDGLEPAMGMNRTNIQAGLETAMAVLNGRLNEKARGAKIFLLSVRRQDEGDARLVSPGKVDVYTFGFGKLTDVEMLRDIAHKSTGGVFTSLRDKASRQLVAGLFSMVANDVRLNLTPQTNFGDLDTMVVAPGTDYTQTTDRATGVITIKFGDFMGGEARKVVVNFTLLPRNDTIEGNAFLALAQHSYAVQNILRNGTTENIKINRTMNLTSASSDDDS